MIVKELELNNFRNYANQKIELSQGVNVFFGNNAQGKTNLLEAVNLFSGLKSHRGAHDRDLINFEREKAVVSLVFNSHNRENKAEIELYKGKRKRLKINGVNKSKFSEISEYFNSVMFCPEDLNLIKGSPSERRRFLDLAICPLKPAYMNALVTYNKILDNKNKLLKEEKQDDEMILLWNEKLCEFGARVLVYRNSFLKTLKPVLSVFHDKITGNEKIDFVYKTSLDEEISNEDEVKNILISKTKKGLIKEKSAGTSLYGPHRDEIEFFINGHELKNFGSQGQQRTVVLGLKLSQIEIARQVIGEYPVLLLDDILSELDNKRQSFLLDKINDMQVLITCTDSEAVTGNKNGRFFKVDKGCVYCE